jgi:hypothetical protein
MKKICVITIYFNLTNILVYCIYIGNFKGIWVRKAKVDSIVEEA